jgi:Spy/CpxP family protein refolding chaperone
MNRFVRSIAAVATVALSLAAFTAGDVALGTTTPVMAQDAPGGGAPGAPGGPQRGQRMGQMLMSLNLSDAQKAQIKSIMADARAKGKTLTDRDAKRANMRAAFAKIDTVLTPPQRTKLHAQMEAARAQRAGNTTHS